MNFPQIHQISADDMRKIFPNKYYKKYAYQYKVLQHESKVLNKSGTQKDITKNRKEDKRESMPNIPQRKQYNPRYEGFQSTIELNKQQVIRLNKFTKALKLKLEITPEKKVNQIRSPLKNPIQATEDLLQNLKAIEDLQNQRKLKERQKRKKYFEKKQICKFTKKIKSTQVSPMKSLSPMETHFINPEEGDDIQAQNMKSEQLPQLENSRIMSKAKFLNLKLVTNFQKKESLIRSSMKDLQKIKDQNIDCSHRKDLLQETRKIRHEVTSMETLSLYQAVLLKKKRKEMLSQL